MNPSILHDLTCYLIADYQFKEKGQWLQQGVCPSCGKKELFTKAESPWVIRCGRENHCAWEGHAKELYPDLFEGFNKRYKPTQKKPNATADAYMQYARGFDLKLIKGWYEQGKFWHPDGDKGTATVRFWLDEAKTIHMERLIEEVTLTDSETGEKKKRKAHFKGSHSGLWWQPPGMKINEDETVWLTEGCLDAIALRLNGVKAVATLSCSGYPEKSLGPYKGQGITWVWALDSDKAGREAIKKHVKKMRGAGFNVGAAQIHGKGKGKIDWNDLHQQGRLTNKNLEEYLYRGSLLIARLATEKALLMYNHTERKEFPFEHDNRTYWFKVDVDKFHKSIENIKDADNGMTEEQISEQALKECGSIAEIANCYPRFLYYQSNIITDESWYYCRVTFPHAGQPVKNTFTGGQLSGAAEFGKRLLSIAPGAVWTGATSQLDRIKRDQLYNIKTVQTLDFIGYSKEYGCYVYNDIAIKNGQRYNLNDEDFFDAGKLSIKSLNQSVHLNINSNPDLHTTEWVAQIFKCFGPGGLVALVFWFGSLFADQIRGIHKSFPFIEIIGEPGSGKTTLIEFLWKLVGRRDYEGFDPSKSTLAARARNFAQVSNLPVVLIEADRDEDAAKSRRFDWDELKTAYNGRSVRSRGMKNSGNETYEPPFRGTICISQNAEVNASEAVLQRIIHLKFTKAGHTPETKRIAEHLERIPMEQVSGFILSAITKEKQVMETVKTKTSDFETMLLGVPEIKSVRIAKNHAQLIALLYALDKVIKLPNGALQKTEDCLVDIAIERQCAINADHPIVQEFWEVFNYLNGEPGNPQLNHAKSPDLIAINLNHFIQVSSERKQQIPPILDLKRHLKTSRARKYSGQKAVGSNIWLDEKGGSKTVKCWVFQREGKA